MKMYRITIEVADEIDGKGNPAWVSVNRPELAVSGCDIESLEDLVDAGEVKDLQIVKGASE